MRQSRFDGVEWDPVARTVDRNGMRLRLSRTGALLFDALFRHPAGYPDAQSLSDAMYANELDGGPDDAKMAATVYAVKLRVALASVGLTITLSRGRPRCGYQLVQREGLAT